MTRRRVPPASEVSACALRPAVRRALRAEAERSGRRAGVIVMTALAAHTARPEEVRRGACLQIIFSAPDNDVERVDVAAAAAGLSSGGFLDLLFVEHLLAG